MNIIIEYSAYIAALMISIYVAFQEGFAKKNITLILVLLLIVGVDSLFVFPSFKTAWIQKNLFLIVNIEMLLEVAFYLLLYIFMLEKRRYRLFLTCYLLFFLTFSLISSFELQPIQSEYPIYSFVFGSVGVLIGIFFFFNEKLNAKNTENIFRNFWFWISAGLFIFLAAEIPLMSLINHILHNSGLAEDVEPVKDVKQIISFFYYLMYLIGVLCMMKKT